MDPVFAAIARAALLLLFAQAALHKARDLPGFAQTVRDYRLLPAAWSSLAARIVIAMELAVVIALALPGRGVQAGALAIGVLALYSGAIAANLARGRRHLDCGCLGPGRGQPISAALLARNGLLALAAVLVLIPAAERTLVWVDAVSIGGGVAMLALLWHAGQQLGRRPATAGLGRSS